MEKNIKKKNNRGLYRLYDLRLSTKQGGFTLIELLVVLSIFIILTAVVLARQNRFSSDILLTDLAYQIAINIRQAQVYGLGVKYTAANNYDIGYGIDFNLSTPTIYCLFADTDKNKSFDGTSCAHPGTGGVDTVSTVYQIQKGGTITALCAYAMGTSDCASPAPSPLDVVYVRPDPEAHITSNGDSKEYSQVIITITSLLGDRAKCVIVDETGQVSVENPPNPDMPTSCS